MKHALEEDLLLKRFLLGELPEGERGEVEERLFSDPEYFRLFRAAEEELTDEYIYGDLDAGERERFERYFLTTPERRESLRVARALKQYISRNAPAAEFADVAALDAAATLADTNARADAVHVLRPEKKSFFDFLRAPALRFSLAAAAVLIVAVGLWLLARTAPRDRPEPSQQANAARLSPEQNEQLAQATPEQGDRTPVVKTTPAENVNGDSGKDGGVKPPKPPRQTPSRVYSFLILPLGQVRDGGDENDNEVSLPADAGVVNLRIPLIAVSGRGRYRVTLQTDAGRNIKSWTNLKPAKGKMGRTLSVKVPASTLTQQNYRLKLAAANGVTVSTLHFKVTRQR